MKLKKSTIESKFCAFATKKHTITLTLIEFKRNYNRMNTKSGDLKYYCDIY